MGSLWFIRGKRQSSSPRKDESFQFIASVSEDIEKLSNSFTTPISLLWLSSAMRLLGKMQLQFLILIEQLGIPTSLEAGDWVDQYMEETAALLDFFNILSSAIFSLQRHSMYLEFLVKKQPNELLEVWSRDLESNVQKGGHQLIANPREIMTSIPETKGCDAADNLSHVADTVRITTVFVALLLASAILAPVEAKMNMDGKPESLRRLVIAVQGVKGMRINASFMEWEMVQRAIEEFKKSRHGQREAMLHSDELVVCCTDLRSGLQNLSSVVDQVFKEVIVSRKRMMGFLMQRLIR